MPFLMDAYDPKIKPAAPSATSATAEQKTTGTAPGTPVMDSDGNVLGARVAASDRRNGFRGTKNRPNIDPDVVIGIVNARLARATVDVTPDQLADRTAKLSLAEQALDKYKGDWRGADLLQRSSDLRLTFLLQARDAVLQQFLPQPEPVKIQLVTKTLQNGKLCFLAQVKNTKGQNQALKIGAKRQTFLLTDALVHLDNVLSSLQYKILTTAGGEVAIDNLAEKIEGNEDGDAIPNVNYFQRASIIDIMNLVMANPVLYQNGLTTTSKSMRALPGFASGELNPREFTPNVGFGNYIRMGTLANGPIWDATLRNKLLQSKIPLAALQTEDANFALQDAFQNGAFKNDTKILVKEFLWIPNQLAEFYISSVDDLPYFFNFESQNAAHLMPYARPDEYDDDESGSDEGSGDESGSDEGSGDESADEKITGKKQPRDDTTPDQQPAIAKQKTDKTPVVIANKADADPDSGSDDIAALNSDEGSFEYFFDEGYQSPDQDGNFSYDDDSDAADPAYIEPDLPNADSCLYLATQGNGGALTLTPFIYVAGRPRTGGDGRMRADSEDEGSYNWCYVDKTPRSEQLAAVLGLDPNRLDQKLPIPASLFGLNDLNKPQALFYYHKTYEKKAPKKRKNQPKATKPVDPRPFDKAKLGAFALYKKRKGDSWSTGNGGAKAAVPLTHPTTKRLSAGSVMSKWFREIGIDRKYAQTLGSATTFANTVVNQTVDAVAYNAWKATLDGKPVTDWLGNTKAGADEKIRTEQEWCHLLGHGDGGTEEPFNFVSGSRHCNTEQLAIEIGHRTARRRYKEKLVAKITAYLLPNDGARMLLGAPIIYTTEECTYLDGFRSTSGITANSKPKDLLALSNKIGAYLSKNMIVVQKSGLNPCSLFSEIPLSDDLEMMTDRPPLLSEFDELPVAGQRKALKEIAARLTEIALIASPLANFIRYKVYYEKPLTPSKKSDAKTDAAMDDTPNTATNTGDNLIKLLDYFMDAQIEHFDYKEYLIVQEMTERVCTEAFPDGETQYWDAIAESYWSIQGQTFIAPPVTQPVQKITPVVAVPAANINTLTQIALNVAKPPTASALPLNPSVSNGPPQMFGQMLWRPNPVPTPVQPPTLKPVDPK
jgi:hypothetical protein